ncbi:MAG: hypothetical protein H7321_05295, partial [Bacteroidia bacterium]|nr:hypothetical protein [Bacteroidia bacterium]
NDIVFEKGWASAIVSVMNERSDIACFCPYDPGSEYQQSLFSPGIKYKTGYGIKYEFAGWCYLLKRNTMSLISNFDERFSFYFQDDDFCMTLKKFNLKNAVVFDSVVRHLGHQTSTITEGYSYNQRIINDRNVYHAKWGSQRSISLKNKLFKVLRSVGLGFMGKYLY